MQQIITKIANQKDMYKSIGIKWLSERVIIFSVSYLCERPL